MSSTAVPADAAAPPASHIRSRNGSALLSKRIPMSAELSRTIIPAARDRHGACVAEMPIAVDAVARMSQTLMQTGAGVDVTVKRRNDGCPARPVMSDAFLKQGKRPPDGLGFACAASQPEAVGELLDTAVEVRSAHDMHRH